MPPTRGAARKSGRPTNTDAGMLKSAFTGVGKSTGLKVGKNVGATGVAAAKAAVEKTGLVGVVVGAVRGRGKRVVKKKVRGVEEKEGEDGDIIEVIEVKQAVEKEEVVEKEEERVGGAITVTVEEEVVEEVIEVRKVVEPVEKPVEGPDAKTEKSTKGSRGKKRKAAEAPEDKSTKEVTTAPIVTVPALTRGRKRTRLQKEPTAATVASTATFIDGVPPPVIPEEYDSDYVEESTKDKTSKTPKTKPAIKPRTPRSTRNAKFLSIAASTLGQTTLSIPPLLTTSLSTAASTQSSTPSSEVTLSSLNILLTAPAKAKKRPAYFQHLTNLHAHLLTAIHLHHAQNGATSLPDFKGLKPHLERLSKRTMEMADLRRICWITNYDPDEIIGEEEEKIMEPDAEPEVETLKKGKGKKVTAPKKPKAKAVKLEEEGKDVKKIPRGWLKTVDYGNGKIVLELVLSMAGVGEVNNLRREFERRVDAFWKKLEDEGKEVKGGEEVDVPMAEIIVSENKKMVEEVLKAKGQRRLLEMKGVQVLRGTGRGLIDEPLLTKKKAVVGRPIEKDKAEEKAVETTATPTIVVATTTQEKKLSLLDRIRAKHQASLAAAASSPTASLTPEEIAANHARICAQQRLLEVIPILRSLRLRASGGGIGGAGTGRKSMSLDEVVLGIRQSVRSGITKEEAELCVRLAGEQGVDATPKKMVEPVGKGKGGLLSTFDGGSFGKGMGGKDEKGWVKVVECGGVKAVVFK